MVPNTQILMARQPIFDTECNTVAYELLYRSENSPDMAVILNGDQATSQVLINAFTSIYEDEQDRHLPAFVNFTRNLIETPHLPALPPHLLTIELLENIEVDDALITSLYRLHEAGYRIVLDDFVFSHEFTPIMKITSIVKLDIRALGLQKTREQIAKMRKFNVTFLAEKVETREEYQSCKEMGCTLFQGYFLARPELVRGRRLESNTIILLQLIKALHNPDTSTKELTTLIEHDPKLSYRLLRLMNSPALALRRKIANIRDALIIIGRNEITRWVTLFLLSDQSTKPAEINRQVLIVARMSELVAKQIPSFHKQIQSAFLTGLLDGVGILLDVDKTELIKLIPVEDEIVEAIAHDRGPLAQLLNEVKAFTRAEWNYVPEDRREIFQTAYMESLEWCVETMRYLH